MQRLTFLLKSLFTPLMCSPAGAQHPWTVSARLRTGTRWVRGANAGVEGKARETTPASGMASQKPLPCRDVKNEPVTTEGFGKHVNLSSLYGPSRPFPVPAPAVFLSLQGGITAAAWVCSLRPPLPEGQVVSTGELGMFSGAGPGTGLL